MIRCFLYGNQINCDKDLQVMAGALRATRHGTIGFTPNMMKHSREVLQPFDIMTGVATENTSQRFPHQYVQQLAQTPSHVHQLTREHLE